MSSGPDDNDTCDVCGDVGFLICCDVCPRTYHVDCVNLQHVPKGDWRCHVCLEEERIAKCPYFIVGDAPRSSVYALKEEDGERSVVDGFQVCTSVNAVFHVVVVPSLSLGLLFVFSPCKMLPLLTLFMSPPLPISVCSVC